MYSPNIIPNHDFIYQQVSETISLPTSQGSRCNPGTVAPSGRLAQLTAPAFLIHDSASHSTEKPIFL